MHTWTSDWVIDHINSFIGHHNLHRCDKLFGKHDLFTYDNLALNQRSVIDYFITSSAECILGHNVLDPDTNFSDHNPITVSCKIAFLADNSNMHCHTYCKLSTMGQGRQNATWGIPTSHQSQWALIARSIMLQPTNSTIPH